MADIERNNDENYYIRIGLGVYEILEFNSESPESPEIPNADV